MFLEHYGFAALDLVKSSRRLLFKLSSQQNYILMPAHRKSAQNVCESICKLTEISKKARINLIAKESASLRKSDDSSDIDRLDETSYMPPNHA